MEKENYEEILGKKTFRDLAVLKKEGLLKDFYLAGGTGAALFLRHRRSYDLDFFTLKNFSADLFADKLSKAGRFQLEKKEIGTVTGLFRDTRVSFFYYPYLLLKPPRNAAGIKVAHLLDIACMKIDAIAGRGSKKDFIDLYEIIQSGYSLEELLASFQKKYAKLNYNMIHIRKSLVYFADADRDENPLMIKPLDWPEMKRFFKREVSRI